MTTFKNTQLIATEALYDSLGRSAVSTVPVIKQNDGAGTNNASQLTFISDFIASRDPQNTNSTWVSGGELSGSITSWVDPVSFNLAGDPNYAYQGAYFETDPTSRTLQSSKPGITFQKSSDFSNPGYSESYYDSYFPFALYSVLPPSSIQIPNIKGTNNSFVSPNSFPYMPMAAQQTSLGNLGLITQAGWQDLTGRPQAKATVDSNNNVILTSYSYQTGASTSDGLNPDSVTSAAIMDQLQTYLPNFFNNQVTDSSSFYIKRQINALGQLVQAESPDQGVNVYYTDIFGRLRYSQTPDQLEAGMIQYYLYDALNRIIEVGLYPGTWDVNTFQQNTLTLATPQPTQAQVQKSIIYDLLSLETFDPNAQGRSIQVVTYPLTSGNTSPASVTESYTYDTWGRLMSITNQIASIESTTSPFIEGSYVVQYTYNGYSQVLQITYPSGFAVTYSYNLQGLVGQISYTPTAGGSSYSIATYTYNAYNQVSSEVLWDGNNTISMLSTDYTYGNSLNQLTEITTNNIPVDNPTIKTLIFSESLGYTDDPSGNNSQGSYQDGNIQYAGYNYGSLNEYNHSMSYSYDAFGRLYYAVVTPSSWSSQADFGTNSLTGNYDANGNYLIGMNYSSGTNQLSQASISSAANGYTTSNYTYTGSGLINTVDFSSSDSSLNSYTMSWTNDLVTGQPFGISVSNNDTTIDNFLYDSRGERIQKVVTTNNSPSVITYVRGKGSQVLVEYDSTNIAQAYCIQGPLGLVSVYNPTTAQNSFIIRDHLGSTRIVYNASTNQRTSYYAYDAWGNFFVIKGGYWQYGQGLRYFYTGQEWDQELGLYNYHARQYDPVYAKRFLSPDPAHQFASPYIYVGNNPINAIDPTGKMIYVATKDITNVTDPVMWVNMAYALKKLEDNGGDTTIVTHAEFLELKGTVVKNDVLYTIGHAYPPAMGFEGYITTNQNLDFFWSWGKWTKKLKTNIENLDFNKINMVQCYGCHGAKKLSEELPKIEISAFDNLSFSHPNFSTFNTLSLETVPSQDSLQTILRSDDIKKIINSSMEELKKGTITRQQMAKNIASNESISSGYNNFKNSSNFNETPSVFKAGKVISGPEFKS